MDDDNLQPLDVYGRMSVPFDVGTFCRGHKYCVEAVALARACREEDAAKLSLRVAEERLRRAAAAMDKAIADARNAMEKSRTV